MRYMLDTNICIYIIREKPIKVLKKLRTFDLSDIVISAITHSELEYGVAKSSRRKENHEALIKFLASCSSAAEKGFCRECFLCSVVGIDWLNRELQVKFSKCRNLKD